MIVLKHVKLGDLGYVSHKDILKVLQRGLKRAKIEVAYSEGFVPHMRTYTATPLPLGVQSVAEYLTVDCVGISAQEFLDRYNRSMPDGLRGLCAAECVKNPNFAARVVASDYRLPYASGDIEAMCAALKAPTWEIELNKKGERVVKDVRSMIYALDAQDGVLHMRLATGGVNLRVDAFVDDLRKKYGLVAKTHDVVRTAQLIDVGGAFADAEALTI